MDSRLSIVTLLIGIAPKDECIDRSPLCLHWAKNGECVKSQQWMMVNCNAACRSDCTDPKIAFATCSDENDKCAKWKAAGKCTKETAYMMWKCPKSCGFCDKPTNVNSYPAEVKAAIADVKKAIGETNTVSVTPVPGKPESLPTMNENQSATDDKSDKKSGTGI